MNILKQTLLIAAGLVPALLAALGGHLAGSLHLITVYADGKRYVAEHPTTVRQVVKEAGFSLSKGDFLDVTGSVIVESGGGAPTFWMDGSPVKGEVRARPSSRISWRAGKNHIEPVRYRRVLVRTPARGSNLKPIVTKVEGGDAPVIRSARDRLIIEPYGSISGKLLPASERLSKNEQKLVALTFDDGPGKMTPRFLKVLKKHKVKATFFVIGERVTWYPWMVKRELKQGHTVANHSMRHLYVDSMKPANMKADIEETMEILEAAGATPRWFRPPGGRISPALAKRIAAEGMSIVLWDVDPSDWKHPGAKTIAARVVKNVTPGSIVLLHDGGGDRAQTLKALPIIIKKLRARGYDFVNLDELLGGDQTG